MDLILLIILLTVYFVLKGKEDYQTTVNRTIRAREEAAKKVWIQRVTNQTLEREIKNKIFSTQEKEALLDEIRSDGYNVARGTGRDPRNIHRAMMAKNGYIPYNDAIGNTLISYASETDRQILFWCDRKLREQGVPTRLVKSMAPSMYTWEVLIQ